MENKKEGLKCYPLFMGLTRPPMMMGVTQTFFVLNFMLSMIFFLMSMHIFMAVLLFGVLQLFGMTCCWKDEFMFDVLFGKFELACPNRSLWGCNSYDPY